MFLFSVLIMMVFRLILMQHYNFKLTRNIYMISFYNLKILKDIKKSFMLLVEQLFMIHVHSKFGNLIISDTESGKKEYAHLSHSWAHYCEIRCLLRGKNSCRFFVCPRSRIIGTGGMKMRKEYAVFLLKNHAKRNISISC